VTLELLKEEKTVTQIAAEHGIHPGQLHRWKRQALDHFPHLFTESNICSAKLANTRNNATNCMPKLGNSPLHASGSKKSGLDALRR